MELNYGYLYLFKQIDDCLQKRANQLLEPLGLTFSQFRVIIVLREREKDRQMTSVKDIEERLNVSHPTVIGLLRRLEEKGIVRTETGVADRRVRNVFLAKSDPAVWEYIRDKWDENETQLMAGLSREEAKTLYELLGRVLKNLS